LLKLCVEEKEGRGKGCPMESLEGVKSLLDLGEFLKFKPSLGFSGL
jgi:hypothetical protein